MVGDIPVILAFYISDFEFVMLIFVQVVPIVFLSFC